jgi:F420-0:gamma-glutamyl ligase
MQTILTEIVTDDTMETVQKALQAFFGKEVKIVISDNNGKKDRKTNHG